MINRMLKQRDYIFNCETTRRAKLNFRLPRVQHPAARPSRSFYRYVSRLRVLGEKTPLISSFRSSKSRRFVPALGSQRVQSFDTSNCSRSDIGGGFGAGADPVADPGPGGQLLAEAPVIPALRVPARELARRPGEPAAAERYPGRGAPTAPRFPRDTDAVDAAPGPEHTGDHSGTQLRRQ